MKKQLIIIAILSCLVIGGWFYIMPLQTKPPIKVGILHSLTGTMAISETAVVDATLLAIDELNQKGGILGRKIEPIVVDGRSDWPTFANGAEKLITQENVSVVFGCWTSASRKTVKPVFEKYNHLLFYPVQYEGLEQSPHIIYTGAAPNQQIIPVVKWSFDNLGKRIFLVASDYVFPRAANAIIKGQAMALSAKVVGEEYILLGSRDVKAVVQKILATKPDVVLNTINGDTNVAFFTELHNAGITPEKIPVMSFSIAENELHHLDIKNMTNHYAAWNYFQTVNTKVNQDFVKRFKNKYGQNRVTNDPMEAAYFGVYLWAQAVEDTQTIEVNQVRNAMKNQSFQAPGGLVYVDDDNNHTWKTVRIGKIRQDGQFDIVWTSERPVQPIPYPTYRLKSEWHKFLDDLYTSWGNQWANPGISVEKENTP
ncbi:urea ABC transporter substrate-binding protein [Candidatus Parabeggiatoa sp. HSG14]|uniref:urea ABC transporter substrate-binding protein n=1 Tax=Candidatus Parabeggiatoa sp. HSG14 TaxID=3055593 RepID=UPI0025A71716|nr:urea ABC transporter substrate-binding protein [Thiotrichales bacterium HSG14]